MATDANYCVVDIATTRYTDVRSAEVRAATADNNSSSFFKAVFDNQNGIYNNTFTLNDEVIIHSTDISNPYDDLGGSSWENKIFLGVIEDINSTEDSKGRARLILSGRDYSAILQDITVEPTIYNDTEISEIVTNLMATYAPQITITNVNVTAVTLTNFRINQRTLFDVLQELAALAGFFFYVSVEKDLHFEVKDSQSSGLTLDNTNVKKAIFKKSDRELYNRIWVYGDRVLTKWQNDFISDGAGSEFELEFKPHNTQIAVNGSIQQGGVFEQVEGTPPSGVQYLVNFDRQKVIFTSGVDAGFNLPGSGTGISAVYDRDTPIIKFAEDIDSQNEFGIKSKVIVDKSIKDPIFAKTKVKKFLAEHKNLKVTGVLNDVRGITDALPGNTALCNFPNQDINSENYKILEVKYKFSKKQNLAFQNLTIKVSERSSDLTDTVKDILLELRRLQATDLLDTDTFTRIQSATGSIGLKVKSWKVATREINNSFVLGHPINGVLGSNATGPVIGDFRSGPVIIYSGGE